MIKTTLAIACALCAASAVARAQTGSFQELPTTVMPLPSPPPQPIAPLPSGNVSIITTLPNLPPGGTITGPGPIPGVGSGSFVMLGAPPLPPTWTKAPGLTEVATTNRDEKREGRWICRANYGGFAFVGHRRQGYGKNMCVFALGDKVMTVDEASMLYYGPGMNVRWMSLQGNQVPQGIVFSMTEPGRGFPLCRALIQNVMNSGWVDGNGCHVVHQERAVVIRQYEVVAIGQITQRPAASAPYTPPSFRLDSVFDVEPGRQRPGQ